ncbi:HAD family hydrolase [Myxacorys almedinensis]|uniref:HAD family hydrolase n=1 Tax=Myxacorys almedinensis A TaxID=2690445 RepID=A0A8J8CKF0_9CYAN|nr:HAD family hydrolase [Myxacorys almedinensis]NDJ16580.1 HAD family hydrolase [Myxacorys almedinensis A]
MPASNPTLLALDFDGVICDGLKEYFQTAWKAYCQIWQPDQNNPPKGLDQKFYRLRPVVETGWEMPVLLRALVLETKEDEILERWVAIASEIITNHRIKPPEVSAIVDTIRDHWIASDLDSWLAEHRFYPGVVERLQKALARSTNFVIISTKEGRFIKQLLLQQGLKLSDSQVYGKETKCPKHQILQELNQKNYDNDSIIWFIEDRLKTLQVVQHQPALETVELFLANWGYNTSEERQQAFRDSRINLLSLDQFRQDFSMWC